MLSGGWAAIIALTHPNKPMVVTGALIRYTSSMATKKTMQKTKTNTKKVDFEPNKMGLAVASLSAVTLALLGVIVAYS